MTCCPLCAVPRVATGGCARATRCCRWRRRNSPPPLPLEGAGSVPFWAVVAVEATGREATRNPMSLHLMQHFVAACVALPASDQWSVAVSAPALQSSPSRVSARRRYFRTPFSSTATSDVAAATRTTVPVAHFPEFCKKFWTIKLLRNRQTSGLRNVHRYGPRRNQMIRRHWMRCPRPPGCAAIPQPGSGFPEGSPPNQIRCASWTP